MLRCASENVTNEQFNEVINVSKEEYVTSANGIEVAVGVKIDPLLRCTSPERAKIMPPSSCEGR